ncbi:MAG: hypothetical protein FJZ63_02625 [Chlamydiae bacterium]|nr:hypothetical protein [Chlamydiota bacterium]
MTTTVAHWLTHARITLSCELNIQVFMRCVKNKILGLPTEPLTTTEKKISELVSPLRLDTPEHIQSTLRELRQLTIFKEKTHYCNHIFQTQLASLQRELPALIPGAIAITTSDQLAFAITHSPINQKLALAKTHLELLTPLILQHLIKAAQTPACLDKVLMSILPHIPASRRPLAIFMHIKDESLSTEAFLYILTHCLDTLADKLFWMQIHPTLVTPAILCDHIENNPLITSINSLLCFKEQLNEDILLVLLKKPTFIKDIAMLSHFQGILIRKI